MIAPFPPATIGRPSCAAHVGLSSPSPGRRRRVPGAAAAATPLIPPGRLGQRVDRGRRQGAGRRRVSLPGADGGDCGAGGCGRPSGGVRGVAAHATAIAPSCVPVALSLSVLGAGIALGIAGAMFEVMLNVLYGSPPAPNDNELCDYCSGFGTVPCELCLGVGSIRTPVSSLSFTTTTTSSSSSSSFTASSTPIYHELSTTSPSSSRPSTRVCPMCSGSRREACRPCAGSGFSGYKKGHRPFTRSIAERARSRVAEEGWIEGPVTSGRATASCEGREA